MVELPPFETWYPNVVAKATIRSEDVKSINTPPSNLATSYHSMYAFGNHLQITSVKHLSTSYSRAATTFQLGCWSHLNDWNPVMASPKYFGWIKKTLELDYGQFHIVLLLCNWMVANYESPNATSNMMVMG